MFGRIDAIGIVSRLWNGYSAGALTFAFFMATGGGVAASRGYFPGEKFTDSGSVISQHFDAQEEPIRVKQGEMVFLLHGIGKSSNDMAAMAKRLRKAGYAVVNWNYPSTKYNLEQLSDKLDEQVERFPDYKIHFVTHSMGGIVVRTFLTCHNVKKMGRLVMIAPPSQGAELAQFFGNWPVYRYLFGPAGQELRPGELGRCANAGIPDCEFGIIAGGTGRKVGMNPLLPGDNDGTVTVKSTRLDGAADFAMVPYPHPVIQMMPRTIDLTINFLENGRFSSPAPR